MLDTALLITQALLGAAVLCAVVRVFRGPSVLDRVIAVDVTLLVVSSMLLVDMIARDHRDFVLFVIAGAMIGFLGAVAIARFIPVRRPEQAARSHPIGAADEPRTTRTAGAEPSRPTSEAVGDEDPATSWFTALARSRREQQRAADARPEHDEDRDEDHDEDRGGAGRREEER